MSLILNIDTSTRVCSVALAEGGRTIAERFEDEGLNHARLLTPFISEVLEEAGYKASDLDAVAISKGPGSYTGLRIGVSVSKGMVYALSIPLVSVSTLEMMASGYLSENHSLKGKKDIVLCPVIDARRMEIYSALFDTDMLRLREVKAEIIDSGSFSEILEKKELHIFGDGASKCAGVIKSDRLIYKTDFRISASFMAALSYEKFKNEKFEDVAYFEPFYLKDFIATVPKNKIL